MSKPCILVSPEGCVLGNSECEYSYLFHSKESGDKYAKQLKKSHGLELKVTVIDCLEVTRSDPK